MRKLLIIFLLTVIISCDSNQDDKIDQQNRISKSTWRAELRTEKTTIPFNFELFNVDGAIQAKFINGEEKLLVEDVRLSNDSIFIPGYIFESEIQAKILDSNHISGIYKRFDTSEEYEIPFEAFADQAYRIRKNVKKATFDYTGKWEVTFVHEKDTTKAIGIFEQKHNFITGTFLTATGDYRFLKGEIDDDEMILSTFDGAHVFVFRATPTDDGKIKGKFFSGKHWEEDWTAVRSDEYELPNPEELTFMNDGFKNFEFSFPNIENGKMISSTDERFKNKVTIVQIMGSWCPNCMDEINYLTSLKNKFPELEIVALAFEKDSNFNISSKRVQKVKDKLGANYPFLIAGTHNKKSASEALPMLNKISSYPTAVMINKNGEVVNIHTGFNGPGTGNEYLKFVNNYTLKVKNLLSE